MTLIVLFKNSRKPEWLDFVHLRSEDIKSEKSMNIGQYFCKFKYVYMHTFFKYITSELIHNSNSYISIREF